VKVILIDGPRAGQVTELREGETTFVVPVHHPGGLAEFMSPLDPGFVPTVWQEQVFAQMCEAVAYWVHRFYMCGEIVNVGSCEPGTPDVCSPVMRIIGNEVVRQVFATPREDERTPA
jgi:hypothetical protein